MRMIIVNVNVKWKCHSCVTLTLTCTVSDSFTLVGSYYIQARLPKKSFLFGLGHLFFNLNVTDYSYCAKK